MTDNGLAALAERRHGASNSPHRLHSLAECPNPETVSAYMEDAATILADEYAFVRRDEIAALRAIVKRAAGMGLCSQTHHEHLMIAARAALAAVKDPAPLSEIAALRGAIEKFLTCDHPEDTRNLNALRAAVWELTP
jgi:hypothetical protein